MSARVAAQLFYKITHKTQIINDLSLCLVSHYYRRNLKEKQV